MTLSNSDALCGSIYPGFAFLESAPYMSQYTRDYQEQEAADGEQQQELDVQLEAADDEQEEQNEDEEEQSVEVQVRPTQDDDGPTRYTMPGPTQSVCLVYPELCVPSGEPMVSLAAALAYGEQLAAGTSEEEQLVKKKLHAANSFSRRVVREFAVGAGQDGAPVLRETSAMRFMSFELEDHFALDRSGFMVQGPPQSKHHVPGQYSTPASMPLFPRQDVIIGSMSQLANIDGRSSRNKEKTWSAAQQAQVRGAVARISGRVLLGSGLLLCKNTVVAFPGVCVSDSEPLDISKLDLREAPFTDIKCAKNAAVLYTEPLCADYGHFKMQAYKIDQYALEGYAAEKDDLPDDQAPTEKSVPIVPRFALVHRVIGTIGEIIDRLRCELQQLETKKLASKTPSEFMLSIQGACERIAELETYDATTKVDFYAYQMLDEKQAIAAYTEKLSTFGKPDSTAVQLRNCVKTIVERQNTITYTLDWTYHTESEPEAHVAFAKIALPIVPHAVYAQLQLDYVPDDPIAAPAKKGTKRSGAGVPISATLTENQVLAKQQPPPETPAPTRGVRFMDMEPGVIPGLSVQPSRIGVITKQPAPTPTTPAKAPSTATTTTTTTTTAADVFRKVAAPSTTTSAAAALRKVAAPSTATSAAAAALRKVAAPGDAPKTPPTKAPTTKAHADEKAPADEKAEQPAATAPEAKKPRTQQPPTKPEAPTSSAVVAPQRTPEQQAMVDGLREMLTKLLARQDAERFGVWGDIATTDLKQYANYPHPEPPANMEHALLDHATALVYGGLAEIVLRGLSQEDAPSRAPPTVSRRPKL